MVPSLWAPRSSTRPYLCTKAAQDWQAVRKGLSSRHMYLDEEDALRPVSTKPSSSRAAWLGGGAVLLVVIAGGLVAALTGHDDETPVATALETEAPSVAPRSQGQLAEPSVPASPAAAPVPAEPKPSESAATPTPTPAPVPASPSSPPKPSSPSAPPSAHASRPTAREANAGAAQTDLLQQLSARAGELAVEARKPVAPELGETPTAPTQDPELSDEPVDPPPPIVPELNDEPPLD